MIKEIILTTNETVVLTVKDNAASFTAALTLIDVVRAHQKATATQPAKATITLTFEYDL